MKGLDRPLEEKVRNAAEMREFMQSMGLCETVIERAIKVKYNLPGSDYEPSPTNAVRVGRRGARPNKEWLGAELKRCSLR